MATSGALREDNLLRGTLTLVSPGWKLGPTVVEQLCVRFVMSARLAHSKWQPRQVERKALQQHRYGHLIAPRNLQTAELLVRTAHG